MRNYIAYHKIAEWGEYSFREDGVFDHYSRHSRSRLERTIHQNVWVVSGERINGSMAYKLCAVFQPDYIEPLEDEGTHVVGYGRAFNPQIELNDYPWFTELLREQSNFSFGLNEIRHSDILAGLYDLQRHLPPVSMPVTEWFSAADYVNVLRVLEPQISPTQRAMLKAHAEAPNQILSVFELAEAGGSTSDNLTYSMYGRLGHLLGNELEPSFEFTAGATPVWTRYIGEDFRPNVISPVYWKMHPELAAALETLGWATLAADDDPFRDVEAAESELLDEPITTRQAIISSRVGQGFFRAQLFRYWDRSCAVTGIRVDEVLRASHIKPWSGSTNQERLNLFNGLLLVGTLDLLFDAGLISFDDSGCILISLSLSSDDRTALGIRDDMRLRRIESQHLPFLAFHREHKYRET